MGRGLLPRLCAARPKWCGIPIIEESSRPAQPCRVIKWCSPSNWLTPAPQDKDVYVPVELPDGLTLVSSGPGGASIWQYRFMGANLTRQQP